MSITLKPEISVIVCDHKADFIYKCVESIQKSVEVTYEIIIITSHKGLYKLGIQDCIVKYHPGMPAAKRNYGVKFSKASLIAFFDDDVEIDPKCLVSLKGGLYPSVGMTYGKLWNMEHRDRFDEAGGFMTWTGFIWSRAAQNDKDTGQFDKEAYILAGKSASCMVKKEVFNKVGGFDESFGILGEETDLSWRIWLSGKYVLYAPGATGYHAFNTKFKPPEKHYTSDRVHFNGCRNYLTMLIKNLGKEHLWIISVHMMIWFFAGLAMIGTLKIREGGNILRGIAYVLSHLSLIRKKRRLIQSERVINERNIWEIIHKSSPRGYYTQRFFRYILSAMHG